MLEHSSYFNNAANSFELQFQFNISILTRVRPYMSTMCHLFLFWNCHSDSTRWCDQRSPFAITTIFQHGLLENGEGATTLMRWIERSDRTLGGIHICPMNLSVFGAVRCTNFELWNFPSVVNKWGYSSLSHPLKRKCKRGGRRCIRWKEVYILSESCRNFTFISSSSSISGLVRYICEVWRLSLGMCPVYLRGLASSVCACFWTRARDWASVCACFWARARDWACACACSCHVCMWYVIEEAAIGIGSSTVGENNFKTREAELKLNHPLLEETISKQGPLSCSRVTALSQEWSALSSSNSGASIQGTFTFSFQRSYALSLCWFLQFHMPFPCVDFSNSIYSFQFQCIDFSNSIYSFFSVNYAFRNKP